MRWIEDDILYQCLARVAHSHLFFSTSFGQKVHEYKTVCVQSGTVAAQTVSKHVQETLQQGLDTYLAHQSWSSGVVDMFCRKIHLKIGCPSNFPSSPGALWGAATAQHQSSRSVLAWMPCQSPCCHRATSNEWQNCWTLDLVISRSCRGFKGKWCVCVKWFLSAMSSVFPTTKRIKQIVLHLFPVYFPTPHLPK